MNRDQVLSRLEVLAQLTALDTGGKCCAVFVPATKGLGLVTQVGLDQAALDLAQAGWASHRSKLCGGEPVRYGVSILWPVFRDGALAAIVYLDAAPADFPSDKGRENLAQIASTLRYLDPPTAIASYLSCGLTHADVVQQLKRDQLALLLDFFQGNVAAVARHTGVTRETVYQRAIAAKLDINDYRPRRRSWHPRSV